MKSADGKIIVISAPSGCGKSTIISCLEKSEGIKFTFSVSATNRMPREGEKEGKNYYFLTDDEFKAHIDNDDFIEYCEVYPGRFYGTLRSEIENICGRGENVMMDIDVIGALNIKKLYTDKVLCIFILPPDIESLRKRLENRGTDSPEVIEQRIDRAEYEISLAPEFDICIVNDNLETAVAECEEKIKHFLNVKKY